MLKRFALTTALLISPALALADEPAPAPAPAGAEASPKPEAGKERTLTRRKDRRKPKKAAPNPDEAGAPQK